MQRAYGRGTDLPLLVHGWHCLKDFTNINTLNPYYNPMKYMKIETQKGWVTCASSPTKKRKPGFKQRKFGLLGP